MITALAASLSLSASSCATWKKQRDSTHANTEVTALEGSSWTLSSIPGVDLEETPKPVTLYFQEEQRVGGHAGCNGFGGSYVQDGDKLSFSQMISTKMACMPGMATENAYMGALQKTTGFRVQDNQLLLLEEGTTRIILDRIDNKK